MKRITSLFLFILTFSMAAFAISNPKREFRGAWIQCVNGQYLGKTPAQIRQMLSDQLDTLQQCGINAILFQVRAEGDALYNSSFEPWSRFLTGTQGKAPSDGWDPLAWMVAECHKREMECHAWINPYRAKTKTTKDLSPTHAAVRYPERIFEYDGLYIFNPALAENRLYTCMIVEEILNHYDVDGIHMDDYFYPYPVAGVPMPDQRYFEADPRGFTDIADWRRDNVNMLIRDLHYLVRSVKPWVKFGISPFGIYRNSPDGTNSKAGSATSGTQNYDDLYADIVYWVKQGWVDYNIPQIYWNLGTKAADYEVLVHWWNDYCGGRPLFIGQDVERTVQGVDPSNPNSHQMLVKYDLQRSLPNIKGSCQWYAAAVVNNPGNYRTALQKMYHSAPALQPLMPYIDSKAPGKPQNVHAKNYAMTGTVISWEAPRAKKEMDAARQYVIYQFDKGEKIRLDNPEKILAITSGYTYTVPSAKRGTTFVITALDRLQNESKPVKVKM
ncbi:MAG: family 10 glycosylhydrolase [Bacteroidaceae bacterium]|nr:family 10 glycosylhydrolase [Bacteroidaceae bacterium]